MDATELVTRMADLATSPRNRVLILVGAYSGLPWKGLAYLKAGGARSLVEGEFCAPIREEVLGYIREGELADGDLMFRSPKHWGRLDRTAIYRIVATPAKRMGLDIGGIIALQYLHNRLQNTLPT